jgi:hypothetical protein
MVSILALLNVFNPFGATPAEKARKRGDLVYDEEAGEWLDLTERSHASQAAERSSATEEDDPR